MAFLRNKNLYTTLGAGLLGTGVAAGENKLLGEYLPDSLQKVNLGIGATTGLAAALGGRKGVATALLGVPLKQMGLFGVGTFERSRAQQRDLMGLQLDRAQTDLNTAQQQARAAAGESGRRNLQTLAAVLGSGALAYYVWNKTRPQEIEGMDDIPEPVRNYWKSWYGNQPEPDPEDDPYDFAKKTRSEQAIKQAFFHVLQR